MSFKTDFNDLRLQSGLQPVLLAPVADSMQEDENLEPQMVRVREGNGSVFATDTDNRGGENLRPFTDQTIQRLDIPYRTVPTKIIFDTRVAKTKVKRIAIKQVRMSWITPNVNVMNNTVSFYSSLTGAGVKHTVVVPEGFYNTPTLFMDALVAAMNTVSAASLITFTHSIPANNPLISQLLAGGGGGGTYYFDLGCDMILYGSQLASLPQRQAFTLQHTVGAIGLHYTRYVDLISPDLNQYSKNTNSSNSKVSSGFTFRIYLDEEPGIPRTVVTDVTNLTYFNWNRSDTFNTFEIFLLDQYGRNLYIPRYDPAVTPGTTYAPGAVVGGPGDLGAQNDSGFFYNILFTISV